MNEFFEACSADDIAENKAKIVDIAGKSIAIVKHRQSIHAIAPLCPHRAGNLAEGRAEAGHIVCPMHEWRFSLVDGRCDLNADIKIATYPCFVDDGKVFVNPEEKK